MTAARLPPALSPATMSGTRSPGDLLDVGDPAQRRPRVLDGGGKPVLGRQPVVRPGHCAIGSWARRRPRASNVVDRAEHPAAAVVVDDHTARVGRGTRIRSGTLPPPVRGPAGLSPWPWRVPASDRAPPAGRKAAGLLGRRHLSERLHRRSRPAEPAGPRSRCVERHGDQAGVAAVPCRRTRSPRNRWPPPVAVDAVVVDPSDVGEEQPRLARDVGAHVPRCRLRVKRLLGDSCTWSVQSGRRWSAGLDGARRPATRR